MLRLVVILSLLAAQASAGAWPRAEGTSFVSVTVELEFESGITDGTGGFGTLYAEHGMGSDLTLGLDLGGDEANVTKAIGFLRWPLALGDGPGVWAMEFGLGTVDDRFALRPGVAYGRGLTLGDMAGWLAVDSRAQISDGFDGVLETDVTLGLKPRDGHMILLQLQTGAPSTRDAYAKLAPSYVFALGPDRHLEIGVTAGIVELSEVKIKFGLWHEF
ncbi:hypothetical protein [Roseovarius aestuariivivens]|uniref:hypothetical protein n=1 Tax=Roseovarius aestuariivivens TaxID=1888910 RepID=UPI0010822993|nr:hypothetical protein [Roseovarius aestuariivivens]